MAYALLPEKRLPRHYHQQRCWKPESESEIIEALERHGRTTLITCISGCR